MITEVQVCAVFASKGMQGFKTRLGLSHTRNPPREQLIS